MRADLEVGRYIPNLHRHILDTLSDWVPSLCSASARHFPPFYDFATSVAHLDCVVDDGVLPGCRSLHRLTRTGYWRVLSGAFGGQCAFTCDRRESIGSVPVRGRGG